MNHFRRDIEGLRAIAILLVILYHAGVPFVGGGYVGVDVFFVLSGYLITGLLVRELEEKGRIDLVNFYSRRVRRLLPAMMLVVLVTMGLGMLLLAPVEHDGLANTAIATIAYASNVYFTRAATDYLAAPSHINPLLHTWSLSVEEQFYVFWPLLMLVAAGALNSDRRRRITRSIAIVATLSFALSLYLTLHDQPWAFFLPFSRAWEFAVGALAALAPVGTRKSWLASPQVVGALGWTGLAGICIAGVFFGRTTPFPGIAAILPAASTAMILLAGSAFPERGVGRLLGAEGLQAIGRVSYSWYLWHWPLLIFAATLIGSLTALATAVTIALSLVAAYASHRWVESPVRKQPSLAARPRRSLALAATGAAAVIAVCIGWKGSSARWEKLPSQEQFSRMRNDYPEIYRMGCDLYYRSAEVKECSFGSPTAPHTAVLLGDSHAGHWFPAAQELFGKGDWRLVVITKSACPIVDATYFFRDIGRLYTECHEWYRASMSRIQSMRPDLVVVSYAEYQLQEREWQGGIQRAIDELSASGASIAVLRDVPLLPFDGPTCLARVDWRPSFLPGETTCVSRPRTIGDDRTYQLQQLAAAQHDNVVTVDMTPEVCPHDNCQLLRAGIVTYRDAGHLTTEFSRSLAAPLSRQLDERLLRMKKPPGFSIRSLSDHRSASSR